MDPVIKERMQSYVRGFRAGACQKAIDPFFAEHSSQHISEAYSAGYRDGLEKYQDAVAQYALRFGYVFSDHILR